MPTAKEEQALCLAVRPEVQARLNLAGTQPKLYRHSCDLQCCHIPAFRLCYYAPCDSDGSMGPTLSRNSSLRARCTSAVAYSTVISLVSTGKKRPSSDWKVADSNVLRACTAHGEAGSAASSLCYLCFFSSLISLCCLLEGALAAAALPAAEQASAALVPAADGLAEIDDTAMA